MPMPRRYKHRRKVGRLCQRFRAHVFSARGAVVIGARPSTARGRRVRADHSVRPEWSLQGPCSDHWGPASHVLHSLRALIRSAREAASRVPPRGGAAEVRHCPVPVRCSGWGSVPGSAAPGPCVTPWLHGRRDRGCTAAVTKVGRRSGRGLLLHMRPMPGHVFWGHGPPPAPEPLGSRAPAHSGARRGPEHPRPSRPNHCTDCHRACSCASDPASGM